jgi:hypothetical protein
LKIAYLITAYSDFAHLERLVGALDAPGVWFFIHIDARSTVPDGVTERLSARGNVTLAPRRPVWWGGWSHVEAILALMKEAAASGGWDYYVVLSGADYPIRSNAAIFETLSGGGEFINATPGFRAGKPEGRVCYYWFDRFDRRRITPRALIMRGAEMALRGLGVVKRRYPFAEIYSGIVWSALSGGCVRYILDYIRDNPRYVAFFRTALIPEEMFFHTIIGNSPFAPDIRHTPTFMDWNHSSASPPLIGEAHLSRLAPGASPPVDRLFARKFNDASGPILDYIDAEFRG